jgi:hypothetical protein
MCPSRGANPFDGGVEPSALEDQVLGLLEDAALPADINDQIMGLIAEGERRISTQVEGS